MTKLGRSIPFDERDVFHQNLVFQLELPMGAKETMYLHFESEPLRALEGKDSTIDDVDLAVGDRRIPLEISASPVFDEEGQVEYVLTVFRDIRERLEREYLRYESETRLASFHCDLN